MPVTIVGALAVFIGILVFAVNIWLCVRASTASAGTSTAARAVA